MQHNEKEVSYNAINTYTVKNNHSNSTKNIWVACHGLGYLSRFFANYFKSLNPQENYIIVPQAPSKYYQGQDFKHVGASWLTRENTLLETQNVLSYLNAVSQEENLLQNTKKLIVFGFSQGVSVALRWVAHSQINCNAIVIHSGRIPNELCAEDFSFLDTRTKVYLLYGTKDEYITEQRINEEREKAETLFGERLKIISFDGSHIVNTGLLLNISEELNQSNE
ncbi:MAG: esterase [Flavobacteriaceae bacterium]